MADTTYINQAVYEKQGGNELVVASGGAITVESGGVITTESGGSIAMESGGSLTAPDGSSFLLAGTTIEADTMLMTILSNYTLTDTYAASGTGLNATAISPGYGYHQFSGPTGMSLASAAMADAQKGAMLEVRGDRLAGDANLSVHLSDGQSMVNGASAISSFEISAAGYAKFVCETDGLWAVVEANFVEHAAA